MEPIAWFATTPKGEELGRLAVQTVQTKWVPVPLWLAPIEPFRWLILLLSSGYPHAKWLGVTYSLLALVVAAVVFWRLKAVWWHRSLVAALGGLNTLLVLSGGFVAISWLNAVSSFGRFWVVPENAPFLLANLHTHTTQSNGFLTPEQVVWWHYWRGYRIVGVTDSNTVQGGKRALEFVQRTGLPVTVLIGEEFRGKTHLVLLNIHHDITPREFDVPKAIKEAKRQGGVVIAAHPWSGRHEIADLIAWGVDGVEVTNGSVLGGQRLRTLCQQHRLAAIGSLDFRSEIDPDTATVLPSWATTPEKVAEALQKGHCAALYLPNEVSEEEFTFWQSWLGSAKSLWQTGLSANLLGIAFWGTIVTIWRRRRQFDPSKPSPHSSHRRGMGILVFLHLLLFLTTAGLIIWAMGRDFKGGWFPPLPFVVGVWALVSVTNWWLWVKLVRTVSLSPTSATRSFSHTTH